MVQFRTCWNFSSERSEQNSQKKKEEEEILTRYFDVNFVVEYLKSVPLCQFVPILRHLEKHYFHWPSRIHYAVSSRWPTKDFSMNLFHLLCWYYSSIFQINSQFLVALCPYLWQEIFALWEILCCVNWQFWLRSGTIRYLKNRIKLENWTKL